MKKHLLKLIGGILASIIIMGALFYFFIFLNPLNIHQVNTLKWVPVVIVILTLFVSGKINKNTPFKFLLILFMPYIFFKVFGYAYFPFIIILFVVGALTLIITRTSIQSNFKKLSWMGLIGIVAFYLFSQPLILETRNSSYNENGELTKAIVLWDFTKNKPRILPQHELIDSKNNPFEMSNLKGKTYFVTFWATWCAPCLEERPQLNEFKKKYAYNADIEFIDISFDTERDKWLKFIHNKESIGLQLFSENHRKTSRLLGFSGLPMHMVVESNGTYKTYSSLEVAKDVFIKSY